MFLLQVVEVLKKEFRRVLRQSPGLSSSLLLNLQEEAMVTILERDPDMLSENLPIISIFFHWYPHLNHSFYRGL